MQRGWRRQVTLVGVALRLCRCQWSPATASRLPYEPRCFGFEWVPKARVRVRPAEMPCKPNPCRRFYIRARMVGSVRHAPHLSMEQATFHFVFLGKVRSYDRPGTLRFENTLAATLKQMEEPWANGPRAQLPIIPHFPVSPGMALLLPDHHHPPKTPGKYQW